MSLGIKRVNFENRFEEQKIPEWYDQYFDYKYLKTLIRQVKLKLECRRSNAK